MAELEEMIVPDQGKRKEKNLMKWGGGGAIIK